MNSSNVQEQSAEQKARLRYHFLAILLLSAAVYYLLDTATENEVLDISLLELQTQDYDYFMTGLDSVHYTTAGEADYSFQASRVTHFPNPEYSTIDSPRIMIYPQDSSSWSITADSGRIELDPERNHERLVLNEDVIINGTTAGGRPVAIFTDSLTVYPDDKSMNTSSDVLVQSEGFTSSSSGIYADLNSNTIRQLANGTLQYDQ